MYIPILMLTLILHVHQVYSEWPLAAAPILIFMCSGMYTLLEKVVGIPKIIFVIVVLRIAPSDGGNILKPSGPQHPHCTCMKEFSVAFCNNVVKKITCLAINHLTLNQLSPSGIKKFEFICILW
jgi:hypothetical protein